MKGFLIATLLVATLTAAEKQRDWQTGTALDSERNAYVAGYSTTQNPMPTYGPTSTTRANYAVYQTYVIESDKFVYVATEHLPWRWSKPVDLIVNGPVKFAVEKKKLYLLDDKGKEHQATISKQILRTK
jgi:hypothetical protein